ncbi:prepilin-type N-terminal cleavage/methylation domain-containing protein [Oricola sp.]|uniref:prepilin-type N-terminal cleavage/methylation domain-containing protein n=1 Tax=Oricola sp. TaxID=1979950 RepID=UPI0025D43790|nr:prepilin-type N-terminal cleavage/methylation domain-containing protein [Oricola sp.]MCI5075347.1 prepilin-type N-terminal cleavage/methylation domain-containing protein [Oricola sp.]
MKRHGTMGTTQRRDAGFTLIEVLVVLLIVALASGTAAFAVSRNTRAPDAQGYASALRDLLSLAQQRAMITANTQAVEIDMASVPVTATWEGTDVSAPPGVSVDLLIGHELLRSDGIARIVFFGEGGSTGARFEISDAKGGGAVVATNWLTGISIVERKDDETRR